VQAVGYAAICVMYIVVISKTDWAQMAAEAQKRAEKKQTKKGDEEQLKEE